MEGLIVESADLFRSASMSKVNNDIISLSLRKQRQQNILCDVKIQCSNESMMAHKCVLYAVSEYCRTLFTGSMLPTYQDGMLQMELGLFSGDTVQVFIDLVYGEASSKIDKVDISDLMRLADYLQVSVEFCTKILKRLVTKDNCVKLLELSLSYNCDKLQDIVESYICNNLKELVASPSWVPSERVLHALLKNPLYTSQSVEIVGTVVKNKFADIKMEYMLISYAGTVETSVQSVTKSVLDDVMTSNYRDVSVQLYQPQIKYFVYCYELYAIIERSNQWGYKIYKYNPEEEAFSFCVKISLYRNCEADEKHTFLWPSSIPEVNVQKVITPKGDENMYILFRPKMGPKNIRLNKLWLLKLNLTDMSEPILEVYQEFSNVRWYASVFCKRTIYFIEYSGYIAYDLDSEYDPELHMIEPVAGIPEITDSTLFEFQDEVYVMFSMENDPHKIRICYLDEEKMCWVSLSEHDMESPVSYANVVSSPMELIFLIQLEHSDDRGESYNDYIYRYDPQIRDLTFWKENDIHEDLYLFVPKYLLNT